MQKGRDTLRIPSSVCTEVNADPTENRERKPEISVAVQHEDNDSVYAPIRATFWSREVRVSRYTKA